MKNFKRATLSLSLVLAASSKDRAAAPGDPVLDAPIVSDQSFVYVANKTDRC